MRKKRKERGERRERKEEKEEKERGRSEVMKGREGAGVKREKLKYA